MSWEWDLRTIRDNAWDTTFRRGLRAWFMLVVVGFIFAFIGASNSSQLTFVDTADQALETTDVMLPHNMDIINSYLAKDPFFEDFALLNSKYVQGYIDSATKSATWVIRLLAINPRYVADNPDEVWFNVIVAALIAIILRYFVQNVVVLGQYRYAMETRFAREVPWRRMLAPFHLHTLLNVVLVMVCYRVSLLLWSITIVGGFYKQYQYIMVPYLLAENPRITWREARQLSSQMTDGYKWKIFVAHLSYAHILILQAIPLIGLLVAVPLESELGAELYFCLRGRPDLDRALLVERAFDQTAYVRLTPEYQRIADALPPTYLLEDLDIDPPQPTPGMLPYPIVELVYCFFVFCFVGWVWEVGLHFVQAHEWVNRGTLYGPWIPIYGVGGVSIIVLLDRYKSSPERLFGLTIILCALLEYACSWILDFMFNASYWDYKGMLFNLNGRICLAGLLAFGLGGLVGEYIAAPVISRKVRELPVRVRYMVAALLSAAFCVDVGYCLLNGFNSGSGVGEEL